MDDSFRLHHVGLLVANVATASEQLIKRFGYVAESPVIEDPLQTAFVMFLKLPGADHWTELVAPNGPGSALSTALKTRKGGTHHLCYEIADIASACERLRDRGMLLVAPPVPAMAFGGRRIAWLIDADCLLVELVESGPGPFSLPPR